MGMRTSPKKDLVKPEVDISRIIIDDVTLDRVAKYKLKGDAPDITEAAIALAKADGKLLELDRWAVRNALLRKDGNPYLVRAIAAFYAKRVELQESATAETH